MADFSLCLHIMEGVREHSEDPLKEFQALLETQKNEPNLMCCDIRGISLFYPELKVLIISFYLKENGMWWARERVTWVLVLKCLALTVTETFINN